MDVPIDEETFGFLDTFKDTTDGVHHVLGTTDVDQNGRFRMALDVPIGFKDKV